MGNEWGMASGAGTVTVQLKNEPLYIHVRETKPEVVVKAVKAAAATPTWAK